MSNKMTNNSTLGDKILNAIESQRLTKKYLYEKMGVSRGTLDNWISGETEPTHIQVSEMFKILGIDEPKAGVTEPTVNYESLEVLRKNLEDLRKNLEDLRKNLDDLRKHRDDQGDEAREKMIRYDQMQLDTTG